MTPSRSALGFALLVAAGVGALVALSPGATALMVPGALSALGLGLLVKGMWGKRRDREMIRWITTWTFVALGTHLAVGAVISASPRLTLFFGSDANIYHQGAVQLLASWHTNVPAPDLPVSKEGFYYLLASLYSVFGTNRLAGVAVNAALSAAIVPVTSDTTDRLFGRVPARYVAPLVALLPGFVVWTGQLLREAAILCLLAVAANAVVRLSARVSGLRILTFALSCSLMFIIRGNVAIMATVGFLAALVVAKRTVGSGLALAVIGFGFLTVFTVVIASSSALRQLFAQANLTQVDTIRADLAASAGSAFAPSVSVSSPGTALRFLPLGLINLLLGPFPKPGGSVRQLLGLGDAATMWVLFPSFLRGVRSGWRVASRRLTTLLIPATAVATILALLLGNYGIVVRERLQVLVLVMPVIALGLAAKRHAIVAPESDDPTTPHPPARSLQLAGG